MEEEIMLPDLEQHKEKAGHTAFKLGWILLGCMLGIYVLSFLAATVYYVLVQKGAISKEDTTIGFLVSFVPVYVIVMPVIYLIMRKVPEGPIKKSKMSAWQLLKCFLVAFPMMYVGSLVGNLLSGLFSGGQAVNPVVSVASSLNPVSIFFLLVGAPVMEELVFRKGILDSLSPFGDKAAILISAICFSMYHTNLFQSFYTFGLGLVLGYVYVKSGRLIYTILIHAVVNCCGSVIPTLILSQLDMEKLEQLSKMTGQIDTALVQEIFPGLVMFLLYTMVEFTLVVLGTIIFFTNLKKLVFEERRYALPVNDGIKAMMVNAGMLCFLALSAAILVVRLFQVV